MRLSSAIQLLEMFAGGPGSGCRGANCGRPHSRYIKQQFTSPSGIKVTTFKPSDRQGKRPINPMKRKHPLKGQFDRPEKHFGSAMVRPGQKLRTWTTEALDRNSGRGATVFVHRYTDSKTGKPKEVIVDEHNWVGHRWRYGAPTRFSFKNMGKAAGYMKRIYGIAIPLKELRG